MKIFFISAILLLSGVVASAYDISLGLAGGASQSMYRGQGMKSLPLPYVGFDSKYVYVQPPRAGVHVYENDFLNLDLELIWMFQEFNSSDNRHDDMQKLDDRHSTLGAGASASFKTKYGMFSMGSAADILDRNDGVIVTLRYSYPYMLSKRFILTPHIGVGWLNSSYNNYYYGVTHKESAKSGIEPYRTGDSFSPFVGTSLYCVITPNIRAIVTGSYTFLASEIQNSPMVDRSGIWSVFGGIMYTF